jgi:hypothetical protein
VFSGTLLSASGQPITAEVVLGSNYAYADGQGQSRAVLAS